MGGPFSAYDAAIILGEGRDSLHDQRAPAARFDAEATYYRRQLTATTTSPGSEGSVSASIIFDERSG
jgi:hypothetical protein